MNYFKTDISKREFRNFVDEQLQNLGCVKNIQADTIKLIC